MSAQGDGPQPTLVEYMPRSMPWGIRRADGAPWRTEPEEPGGADYYAVGDEVSTDGRVLFAGDMSEALGMMLSQRSGAEDLPHPGDAVIVRSSFTQVAGVLRWAYVDASEELLVDLARAQARVLMEEAQVLEEMFKSRESAREEVADV